MKNDGSNLQRLVEKIERSLGPEGFSVKTNQRAYEGGRIVGEFDIVISGKVGSIPIKILIECRDRPSEGPQERGWIQQIIGRRLDFKYDSIVAVSTTGFSEGAKTLAAKENVILRTVKATTDIADAIKPVAFTLANPEIIPLGTCEIMPINETDKKFLLSEQASAESKIMFRELTDREGKSFSNFVLDNLPKTFDQESDGTRFHHLKVFKPVEITIGNRKLMAKAVQVKIRFRNGHIKGKTIAMRNYDGETGILGQEVSVLFDVPRGTIKADLVFGFHDKQISVNVLDITGPWTQNHSV